MTIVYTTIFGGSDSLKPAPAGADRCVCFVDDVSRFPDPMGWELIEHRDPVPPRMCDKTGSDDPRRIAWHLRCVPHELFPDATRTVWIDASFTITDLPKLLKDAGTAPIAALRHHERKSCYEEARKIVQSGQADKLGFGGQLAIYRNASFNPGYLSISCLLVRDNSKAVRKFNETWDDSIRRYPSDNTQVSLDWSAHVHGLTIHGLQGTRHKNPYAVHDHDDHKKRRRPYDTAKAAA